MGKLQLNALPCERFSTSALRRPAEAAGELFSTDPTSVSFSMLWTSLFILYWLLISWGKPTTANIVSKTKAVRRFIPTPASIIFTLFLSDAAPKEPGRLSASCSPFKRTKPPRGSKLTLNTQPFFVFRPILTFFSLK